MSLTGNLEDLPLLDIIQIVSFSKKTGSLSIQTPSGEGGIVFSDGFVVCAFAPDTEPPEPALLAAAPPQREALVRKRLEVSLERLVRLREGPFSFALTHAPPRRVGNRDVAGETLVTGLNAQELLLDLARGMDEDRRDSTAAVEMGFAEPEETPAAGIESLVDDAPPAAPLHPDQTQATRPVPRDPVAAATPLTAFGPAAAAEPVPAAERMRAEPLAAEEPAEPVTRTVLLADDEADVRQVLGRHFAAAGWTVVEAEDPDAAVKAGGRLAKDGASFVLVTDLGMPTSGGSSFQGGFEVVKRLWKMNLRPPVLMMTESLSQSLRLRARQMGVRAFVFKPGLSKLNPKQFEADLAAFAQKILTDLLPRLAQVPVERTAAGRKKTETETAPSEVPPAPAPDEAGRRRGFSFLQRRLQELRQPSSANQIAVLVVKVAREFFERGILFLIKNEEARGLGGFGAAPRNDSLNLLVRQVTLPLDEPSPLQQVIQSGKPWTGALPAARWSNHLYGRIGRFQAGGVSLLPLVAHRETIAVLYGDNPETGREPADVEALEVFVHQAGIALENAFLQKKLQSMQEKG